MYVYILSVGLLPLFCETQANNIIIVCNLVIYTTHNIYISLNFAKWLQASKIMTEHTN